MLTDSVVRLHTLFDTVVLERQSDTRFRLFNDCPEWVRAFADEVPPAGSIISPGRLSDFLEYFLTDAEVFWAAGDPGYISSDRWLETTPSNVLYPLQAHAARVNDDCLLLVTHLDEAFGNDQAILQAAHQNLLSQEQLEREVQRRTAELRERDEELLIRLLGAAVLRDEETGAHIRRLGLYSAVMAEALGWSPQQVNDIRMAAPMHDIGKIGIPDNILQKPGRLTPAEFNIMSKHPAIGAKLLEGSNIAVLNMAKDIAWCHHEKWDGTGYPRGLQGEQIPLSARIAAVADVYDALTHQRVYKPAWAEHEAVAYMQEKSGTQFDPTVLACFLEQLPEMRRIREEVTDETFETDSPDVQ